MDDKLRQAKLQARLESDEAIAKLLKEKEDLISQLQDLKFNDNNNNGPGVQISLKDIEYPHYWQHQYNDFQSFDVDKYSEEFSRVQTEYHKGMPGGTIVRLERVQNKTLWTWYYLRKKAVSLKNNGNPNEKKLYHGSRNDAYDIILKDGLDHRVANLGGAIGAGIYFGVSSGTSSGYVVQHGKKTNKMLYCRVTLGSVGPGQHGLRRPPEKKKGILHDSVGDHHTMFVVFDNHQAYPEYVIHFR